MALTTNINYLQPTGFGITINRENYPNLEYFAQAVYHPTVNVSGVELPVRRTRLAFPGDNISFGDLNVTFLIDEDMNSYTEMYNWLVRIIQKNNTTSFKGISLGGFDEETITEIPTECDITVSMLTSSNNPNKRIRYYNAFPTSISDIEMTATQTDITPLVFTSSFRFAYFEIV